ncbi:hypothetical protein OOK13_40330 [Streptomyces sp. NBC_00378]|nr:MULTISPECIES: hypothetical protein [unclassified Streptomyces]MCX5112195.1 hypothetical protein [Streptomyces sp. NBC_00378]MCX5114610.1 hypothetical protein [Streptomyces sp. NBC_00378]
MTILGWLFPLATACSLLALCAVVAHDIPRITGTVALILTFAALGLALLH